MPSLKLIVQPQLSSSDQVVVLVTASQVEDCTVEIVASSGIQVEGDAITMLGSGSFSKQIAWPLRMEKLSEPASIDVTARAGHLYQHVMLPLRPLAAKESK
jgi:hypothetical protein